MQVHGDMEDVVPLDHASNLHKKLQSLGVTTELIVIPGGNHSVAGATNNVAKEPTDFVSRHLLSP
jgi:dipeptidyl aminopeptidase/acylaminoacyl peptidase